MGEPRLSLVIVGSPQAVSLPLLVESLQPHLREGSAELVVATRSEHPGPLATVPNLRLVQCSTTSTVPEMRSAGLKAARAEIVALTEDFCVPAAGWVEAILTAHDYVDAIAIGGPVRRCRGSAADWALTCIEYGRFFHGGESAAVADLPGINVSYRMADLQRTLSGIPDEFFEVRVHARLRESGCRFWLEADAAMFDCNRCQFASSMRAQFHHGRLYGGQRHCGTPPHVRFFRLALMPAVPIILLGRISRAVARAGQLKALARCSPILCSLILSWTVGEAVGTLIGEGDSRARWV